MRVSAVVASVVLWGACSGVTHAQDIELPRSLVAAVLADPAPAAFAPAPLGTEDYALRRVGEAAPGTEGSVQLELLSGSLVWVRIAGVVVVPRAVLRVRAPLARAGQVRVAGLVHPLVAKGGAAQAEVPIALLVTAEAAIEVELLTHDGTRSVQRFAPVFVPRPEHRGLVMLDSTCSPHGVRVLHGVIPDDTWLHVGCRQIRTAHDDRTAATLELYALWSSAHEAFEVDDVATPPTLETLHVVRVAEARGDVTLSAKGKSLVLGYFAPPHLSAAFIGLGVGPYYYRYQDGQSDIETILPLVTLYASYAFSPDLRFVYFNASVLDPHGSIDQGLYVWFEQARFVDERISLMILLGGNLLVYPHDGATKIRVSIPQGFEVIVRDFLAPNRNLTGGAFIYPQLEGRAYYNVWLRWGSPQFFGELNYIEWEEPHGRQRTRSRAAGVSFGTPLVRFL